MTTSITIANSHGLSRQFGRIPDGCNAFTMHKVAIPPTAREIKLAQTRITSAAKREARKGLSKAQVMALALRTPEERKADRMAAFNERKASILKTPVWSSAGYADQDGVDKTRRIQKAGI